MEVEPRESLLSNEDDILEELATALSHYDDRVDIRKTLALIFAKYQHSELTFYLEWRLWKRFLARSPSNLYRHKIFEVLDACSSTLLRKRERDTLYAPEDPDNQPDTKKRNHQLSSTETEINKIATKIEIVEGSISAVEWEINKLVAALETCDDPDQTLFLRDSEKQLRDKKNSFVTRKNSFVMKKNSFVKSSSNSGMA